jgi:2-polyprenyl-3-methyl-5-hydroxy-6-metoxy-1,4-benzoquinol methylase
MSGGVGNMGLRAKLEAFLGAFNLERVCDQLVHEDGLARTYAHEVLHTFANEARVTLDLVEKFLKSEIRILEVGAGICLFSIFLKTENFNVIALEPALGGFSNFEKIKNAVLGYYSHIDLDVLRIPAQDLNSQNHGMFDLIYSNNVIEHIPDLRQTFSAMTNVLAKDGLMVHACPNYMVPYEPHFGIPVIKKFSGLSRQLFRKKIETNIDLWNSLNFISYFTVKALATKNHLNVKFKRGVLYDSFLRLDTDQSFRERHRHSWILSLFLFLKSLGVLRFVQALPPCFSTPMIIMCSPEGVEPPYRYLKNEKIVQRLIQENV